MSSLGKEILQIYTINNLLGRVGAFNFISHLFLFVFVVFFFTFICFFVIFIYKE